MTTKQKAYFALAITSTVWGTSWIASRMAVQKVPALEVAAIRQLIAGLIFTGFFLMAGIAAKRRYLAVQYRESAG